MFRPKQLPAVQVKQQPVMLGLGLDLISPPGYAKPGTCRFALNYEAEFGGGYRSLEGYERYDGRPAPSDAQYFVFEADAGFAPSVAVGDVVTGATSSAGGTVIWISDDRKKLAVSKKTGASQFTTENLFEGVTLVGVITETSPVIDGFLDNQLSELAADLYRADIFAPSGTGPVRGVAMLNGVVYCWRDVAGALVTYKRDAVLGWQPVPLFSEISFTAGSTAYTDGSTLSQGGASATVKRVVVESGSWSGGTAAGRLIIQPTAGAFVAGAAAGSGVCTLSGPATQITMFGGGRVETCVYNFTGNSATRRLYGCDGVNREWEFDGTVLVPINTGMSGVRAKSVIGHKNHLFFAYGFSLQHSGIGDPYKWTPLFGAGELTTGDEITNLRSVAGNESSAALMALCKDSAWVLYGDSSADWQFRRVSEEAGAQRYSAVEVGGIMARDRDGFRIYAPTDTFGNFNYESASLEVDPLVRNATVKAAVLVKNKNRFRVFFADGLFLSATPIGRKWAWMPCDYGVVVECAVGGEIDGEYRVFFGASNGFVYEADRGRSFDGQPIQSIMRLSSVNQGSNVELKQYRHVEIQSAAESAYELALAAEYSDSNPDEAVVETSLLQSYKKQYGAGLFFDFESWDRAYWDVAQVNNLRFSIKGIGRSIQLLFQSESDNQKPHTLKVATLLFTPRRIAR